MRRLFLIPLVFCRAGAQDPESLVTTVLPAKEPPVLDRSFDWTSAFEQSMRALLLQHGFRLAFQSETRGRLKGPFMKDYMDSVSRTKGWGDGDPFYINYVGHPLQGAALGFVQIQNDPRARNVDFGDRNYWSSRFKAFVWTTAYSTQFEVGPLSEASIGNVGQKKGSSGYVDLLTTPAAGIALIVSEDWIDKRFIRKWEDGTDSIAKRTFLRIALNPGRSLANLLRGKGPWHREGRSLVPVTEASR